MGRNNKDFKEDMLSVRRTADNWKIYELHPKGSSTKKVGKRLAKDIAENKVKNPQVEVFPEKGFQ